MRQIIEQPNSFLPVNFKPLTPRTFNGDGHQMIGIHEPEWPSEEIQRYYTPNEYASAVRNAFNWYTLTQDDKTAHDLAVVALGASNHRPRRIAAIKNSTRTIEHAAAWLIRMAHMGLFLRTAEKRYIARELRRVLAATKEQEAVNKVARPNIQDHIAAKIRAAKGEIDAAFDDFAEVDYAVKSRTVAEILNEFSVPGNRTKDLIDYCQYYLQEFKTAADGKNPELAEAYAHITKRQSKAIINWWEQAIVDISGVAVQKANIRKPRARKPLAPGKVVSKLKCIRAFKDEAAKLDLIGIDPVQILKSTEIWTFNTKTRKLGHYVSLGGATFDVKGTRLTNIDPVKSVQKTLRKPAEQLKEFSNYGKPGAIKWFNAIKAIATPLREAINGDSIILRAVK